MVIMKLDKIVETTTSPVLVPCFVNKSSIELPTENIEDELEKWLENNTLAGFRVWQLAGIVMLIMLTITIIFCCFVKFRIPRTKQNIQADYIRKKITKNFKKNLIDIDNAEIDNMDLKKALETIGKNLDQVEKEMKA